MTAEPRYAIYFTPPDDTPLWRFGSHVLGYDAATGETMSGFCLPEYSAATWSQLTQSPRLYGFHATLKAPFSLNGVDEKAFRSFIADFCIGRSRFRLGPLSVTALEADNQGFVALTPVKYSPDLHALEKDVVIEFDQFRRALTPQERSKRSPERLSERQGNYLDTYGYPFVLDEFRFHMTLTGLVKNASEIADILADEMANTIGTADIQIDALTLFRQKSPNTPFEIVERFAFGA